MRRPVPRLLPAALLLAALLPAADAGLAQGVGVPPHAWLYGTWTGGLYPAATTLTAQSCLANPAVIFAQDVVLRAQLTDPSYIQRLIITARQTPRGVDLVFTPSPPPPAGPLDLAGASPDAGFGCDSPDVLHVERHSSNEIAFPGCREFPNPLVRCPGG